MLSLRGLSVVAVALVVAAPVAAIDVFPGAYKTVFNAQANTLLPALENPRVLNADATTSGGGATYTPAFSDCGVSDAELTVRIQNPFPSYVPTGATSADNRAVLEASGSFFVVPEMTGSLAGSVKGIWFAFLQSIPTRLGTDLCGIGNTVGGAAGADLAMTGAYLEFYRGDNDGSNGWEIPVNTLLVPDGLYGAILRVFVDTGTAADAAANVGGSGPGGLKPIKTAFVYALVSNDGSDEAYRLGRTPESCRATGNPCPNLQDTTPPWAFANPGDIKLTTQNKWVLEFGEAVKTASIQVTINGNIIAGSANDGACGASNEGTCADVDPVLLLTTSKAVYGTRVIVNQAPACGQQLRVSAEDLFGNVAAKTVTATC